MNISQIFFFEEKIEVLEKWFLKREKLSSKIRGR